MYKEGIIYFYHFSADSPVLWLRIDPLMNLLRNITWEQPDYMWQYQLKYERDVIAQSEVLSQALLIFWDFVKL